MRKSLKKLTRHHRVPKSRWGTNTYDNIQKARVIDHRAIHQIFWTDTTIEKIERILQMDGSTLQGDFKRDVQRILNLYRGLEYHSHCIKKLPYKNKPWNN